MIIWASSNSSGLITNTCWEPPWLLLLKDTSFELPDDAGADVLAAFVNFCFFAGWAAVCDAAVKEDARPFTALVFGT